jgi:acetyltransferase-like isoleucine patch superfamily enzyme
MEEEVLLRKISNLLSLLYFYMITIANANRIIFSGRVIVKGLPIIETVKASKIVIGKRVTLNSSNRKYHISLFAPVKLIADKAGSSISIGDDTRIHGTCIHARNSISIGSKCLIAANTNIIDCNGHDLSFDDVENRLNTSGSAEPVEICDCVWIGSGCLILPGSKIGKGSIISANSVVKGEIPPYCLASGSPAKVVKSFKSDLGDL